MSIFFLIVTFEPNQIEFLEHFKRNFSSSPYIIIVDNSITKESINFIASLKADKVIVIQNHENVGIAEAQNIGFSEFLKQGGEYLIQLDQDSSLDKSSLDLLLGYYKNNADAYKLGGVGPCSVNSFTKPVRELKSAGLLMHRSRILDIGFMKSDLFIDLVDFEWCWRAQRMGYSFHVVPCEFFHQLGVNYKLFGSIDLSIPSPVRHYYQVRNSLKLIFLRKSPLIWSLARIPILLFKFFCYPLFLPEGKLRLYYMSLGVMHFFQGKMGKFVP